MNELPDVQPKISLALAMYTNEPCRICGALITVRDFNHTDSHDGPVFAGYARGNVARAAHGLCWRERGEQKAGWAYPDDDDNPPPPEK